MGYIKEPKGVDFVIGPSVLTDQDRKMISEIIANYKRTGKLPSKHNEQELVNGQLHELRRKKFWLNPNTRS